MIFDDKVSQYSDLKSSVYWQTDECDHKITGCEIQKVLTLVQMSDMPYEHFSQ